MRISARALGFWLGLAAATVLAQPAGPSPLVNPQADAAGVPGAWIVAERRADSALLAGFPSTAALLYREVLADAALPAETRPRVVLELVTALLDAADLAAAERELQAYTGPRNSTYQLRAGLLAAQARRTAAVRTALNEIRPEDLSPAERGWWFFLQGQAMELEREGEPARAIEFYESAVQAAVNAQQQTRFALAQAQLQLRVRPPTDAELATMRGNMERYAGQGLGYDSARAYAAGLYRLGRGSEAQAVLQRQLQSLPATERNVADQFRLMLGQIAGETSAEGRRAFRELLRDGLRPETQRTALYLLARGVSAPALRAEREQFRQYLTELIGAAVQHPVIEDLLLVRAQAALADKLYTPADDDARQLLDRFPGSPLRPAALGVRLAVAWELQRYRAAADICAQLRERRPPGQERSQLGVLLAESFFRAGDYKSAADAYDAALREAPQVVPTGGLIFQRVLADIRADRLAEAAALLDEMAGNAAFDVVNRWRAEWNLVREMQVRGLTSEAQARVERLSAGAAPAVPDELRIRLLWLRAKLAFDNQQHEAAALQAAELGRQLPASQIDPGLRREVAATALLLQAQALLALGRDDEGGALLDGLRADYRGSQAAVYSYLVQASRFAQRGDLARAQKNLTDMVDANAGSEFAPFALYQAAVYADRQGLDRNLEEAYNILERLVRDYPRDELVFHARLKQGDLLRKRNDFGAARGFYESLINTPGQPEENRQLAQLALGYTLFAQGGGSPVNYESAAAIFERLRDLPSAAVDLRVEAGYMWGYALIKRSQGTTEADLARMAKAQTVFWSVIDAFLLDPAQAVRLGPTGPYWISRTLLELGQLLEERGRSDEAQRAYRLVLEHGLGGAAQARARLARLGAPAQSLGP